MDFSPTLDQQRWVDHAARFAAEELRPFADDWAARGEFPAECFRKAAGPSTPVIADAALLRRALWNLVDNAVKYGAPPITLALTRQEDRVSFSVTGEGAGIAPEERERVTQPFYRSDVPGRATLGSARTPGAGGEPPRGVGLGLTLARRVAEVHDGALAIGPASTDGGRERGCRVVITIPASPGRPSD